MTTVEGDAGSTVPRRQLGRYLTELRKEAGVSIQSAADFLECSFQKVWRIEKGLVAVRSPDVRTLCECYNAGREMTDALISLARETRAKGWWHSYGEAVPEWFELYVSLEGAASRLRKFEPSVVPGLLHARAYMEVVILNDHPAMTDTDLQDLVGVRIARQGLLSRSFPPPPRLEVILDEGVLRRRPDTPGAMAQQIWHLMRANELAHLSVRVLPFGAGPRRVSASGAFTILDFPAVEPGKGEPTTIYSESLTGALYLDRQHEVERYEDAWSSLASHSLSVEESNQLMTSIIGELNSNE